MLLFEPGRSGKSGVKTKFGSAAESVPTELSTATSTPNLYKLRVLAPKKYWDLRQPRHAVKQPSHPGTLSKHPLAKELRSNLAPKSWVLGYQGLVLRVQGSLL